MTVKYLHPVTEDRLPVDRVLKAAEGKLETVLVLGYTKDGDFYLASSTGEIDDIYDLATLAQKAVMED